MRSWKKINRGLVIAVAAVLGVSIYLISLGISQNAQIPAIKKVVAGYIGTYVSYSMLPAEYRTSASDISQTEMDSYITKMDNGMKSYFASGDSSSQYITNMLKTNLESQKTDTTIVYSYTKEISKYAGFDFDGSTVTVTVDSNTSYDGPNNLNKGIPQTSPGGSGGLGVHNSVHVQTTDNSTERVQLNGVTADTVVLKKFDGNWTVVYSNLTLPSQN